MLLTWITMAAPGLPFGMIASPLALDVWPSLVVTPTMSRLSIAMLPDPVAPIA